MKNIKVPLRWRLKAWWEGYDVADMEAKLRARNGNATYEDLTREEPAEVVTRDVENEKFSWSDARIQVAQLIWGNGYCGPGGPENVIAMSKLLALSPKQSAMVIGAGLGGPARVLAQEFGVWISGYEHSEQLAAKGMHMSVKAGLEKKAPIYFKDFDEIEPFDRNFDRAYSKEAFFTIEKKAELLHEVFKNLKEDSLFLITDYVVRDAEALQDPDVQKWLRQEPLDPFPVTSDVMAQHLKDAGFNLRVNEDITDQYIELIQDAWADADQVVKSLSSKGPEAAENLQAIMKEAQFWSQRTKIMRSGHLQVHRYLAHKPTQIR
ncbi:class I SAM-dependent methyltransferase [Emcibacter sp.]|uniref:class I SAM-dependent methyltransferase n=1 Tax=Emcibacter sp. TaxID=1979954 RepID=UPI002AA7BA9D|nr:class I SAM-dependent methyltransferase [Emcibacter sp.]